MLQIREEQPQDHAAVYALTKAAFAEAEHSDGEEQDLLERLRKSDAFLPALSLVAEEDGTIVGHILFTKLTVGETPALALAPLSVLPSRQKQGIGTALLQEGHRRAKAAAYALVVVLGSAHYYPRVGYRPASAFGIQAPFAVPDENFMALPLQEGLSHFPARPLYAKEFLLD